MSQDPAVPAGVDAEFVTVAEAARALGISDRQARRWAGRLSDGDRKPDGRGGRLVRVSALNLLRGSTGGRTSEGGVSPEVGRTPPGSRTPDADMSDRVPDRGMLLREIVSRQEAEIARLSAALTREQETASKLADRLADADARLAAVLVRQLPPADAGTAPDAATDAQEPQSGATGAQREHGFRRPWWRFWER